MTMSRVSYLFKKSIPNLDEASYCFRNIFGYKTSWNPIWHTQIATKVTVLNLQEDLSEDQKKLLKFIEIAEGNGESVPSSISLKDLATLGELHSHFQKRKFLRFLQIKEFQKAGEKSKRTDKQNTRKKILMSLRSDSESSHIKYGIWNNSMNMKQTPKAQRSYHNTLTLSNYALSSNIIIDCSYDYMMSHQQSKSLCRQVLKAYSTNRTCEVSSNLHLCNFTKNSRFHTYFSESPLSDVIIPMYYHENSYLDLFPKEKIVYLSPDARTEMQAFDPDACYVIGGLVDTGCSQPATLAKAKREGIAVQRLPLDRYLRFKRNKSLTICCVVDILNALQVSNDWNEALQHIPPRFIQEYRTNPLKFGSY